MLNLSSRGAHALDRWQLDAVGATPTFKNLCDFLEILLNVIEMERNAAADTLWSKTCKLHVCLI